MDASTNERLTQYLRGKAAEAKEAAGYNPTAFLSMLGNEGGYATVKKLLSARKVSDGFTRLFMEQRLDLTIEALVVESQWRGAFDPILIAIAEKRLRDVNYRFVPHAGPAGPSGLPVSGSAEQEAGHTAGTALLAPAGTSLPEIARVDPASTLDALCKALGTPNDAGAILWCGISAAHRRVVFTVWADQIIGGKCVLWSAQWPQASHTGTMPTPQEVAAALQDGYGLYAIVCTARAGDEQARTLEAIDAKVVLVLQPSVLPDRIDAQVNGEIAVADLVADRQQAVVAFAGAIDDIGDGVSGVAGPGRHSRVVSGFRRNPVVRQQVVARAGGKCEHCGAPGFELPDGTRYVEAHHVIALADNGPDALSNVIALCPGHHRQAHYGRDAEALEQAFLATLARLAAA